MYGHGLGMAVSAHVQAWCCGLKAVLHGINPANPTNKQVLQARALVQQAHSQQRQVRFWGHPDTPAGWQVLSLAPSAVVQCCCRLGAVPGIVSEDGCVLHRCEHACYLA